MYIFHKQLLPSVFSNFFTPVSSIHNCNTRLASKSSFALPISHTNYGIFSIRFQVPRIWNSVDESLKSTSLAVFRKKLKNLFIDKY